MKKSFTLAIKDLRLLVRDKSALFWVLAFPLMIAIIFGSVFGGSNGASKIDTAIIDQDRSNVSGKLADKLRASSALNVVNIPIQPGHDALFAAANQIRQGRLTAYVLIPKGYQDEVQNFRYSEGPSLQIGIDPTRQAESGMLQGVLASSSYAQMGDQMQVGSNGNGLRENIARVGSSSYLNRQDKQAIVRVLRDVSSLQASGMSTQGVFQGAKIVTNPVTAEGAEPSSNYEVTFPQALIWGLLGIVSSFVISMVKEREQGTLVRLQTSMSMMEILMGKALACLLSALGMMTLLLLIGHWLFGVRLSSPLLLGMALLSGSLCIVGIMMLLSVLGRTEQAVSGSSWAIMITMSMFGGGMIPVFLMPGWMKTASNASPLKWTVLSIEGAIWRGFSFSEMVMPCLILVGIGAACFTIGVKVLQARA